MKFKPHDHRMWAVIGIYGGCEQKMVSGYRAAEYLNQDLPLTGTNGNSKTVSIREQLSQPTDFSFNLIPAGQFTDTPQISPSRRVFGSAHLIPNQLGQLYEFKRGLPGFRKVGSSTYTTGLDESSEETEPSLDPKDLFVELHVTFSVGRVFRLQYHTLVTFAKARWYRVHSCAEYRSS